MGNSICDRLFVSLASGDSINSHWSPEHQQAMAQLASLDDRGRQMALKSVADTIDKEMLRYFQVASTPRSVPFDVQSLAEQARLLPLTDPLTAKRWNFDDAPSVLKDLRLLTREAESSTIVVNEINYLTHLYLLFEGYKERKRIEQEKNKPNLMTQCLEAFKRAAEQVSQLAKDSFVNAVVQISLDSIVSFAGNLEKSGDATKLSIFVKKVRQITNSFTQDDRADQEDMKLTAAFERLALSIFSIIKIFTGKVASNELDELTAATMKLAFYLGKISFHLKLTNYLLQNGLYKTVNFQNLLDIKEIKDNALLFLTQSEIKRYQIKTPIEGLNFDKAWVMADHNRLYLEEGSHRLMFNRYPDFAFYYADQITPQRNNLGKLFFHKGMMFAYKDQSVFMITPKLFEKEEGEEILREHEVKLVEPSDKGNIFDDRLKSFNWENYEQKDSWPFSTGDNFVLLSRYHNGDKSIYTLKFFVKTKEESDAILKLEVGVHLNDSLENTLDLADDSTTQVFFISGVVLTIKDRKELKIIDPWTGRIGISPQHVQTLSEKVYGIDCVRNKIVHVSEDKLFFSKVMTYSQYQIPEDFYSKLKPITSNSESNEINDLQQDKIEGNFKDYFMILVRMANSHPTTTFHDDKVSSGTRDMVFFTNKLELKTETLEQLIVTFELISSINNKRLKTQITLGLLKILDVHLGVAAHLQNIEKESLKVLSQEMTAKLRKLIMLLEIPDDLPMLNQAAFQELKFTVISNLLLLTVKLKKHPDSLVLSRLILSNKTVHSHDSLAKILSNIFGLKKKLGEGFTIFMENFTNAVCDEIGQQAIREEAAFLNPELQPDLCTLNVAANLRAFITSCIGLRGQIPETFLEKVVEKSVQSAQLPVQAISKYLNDLSGHELTVGEQFQVESTVLSSFSAFIISKAVTFMSYSPLWVELIPTVLSLCNLIALATKSLKLPKGDLNELKGEAHLQTRTFTNDPGCSTACDIWSVYLGQHTSLEITMTGADDAKDTLAVFARQEFDNHDPGNSNEITRSCYTPICLIRNDDPVTVHCNKILIVLSSENIKAENDVHREIEVTVKGKDLAVKKSSRLETLSALCSNFITQQLLKEIKDLNEKSSGAEEMPETTAASLELVFASHLFDNGFCEEIFTSTDKVIELTSELSAEVESRQAICQLYFLHLAQLADMKDKTLDAFEVFCEKLQTDIGKKNLQANLLGPIGLILAKSAFIVALKHYDKLDILLYCLGNNESIDNEAELRTLWLGCSKIRTLCRTYETDRQFQELFRKLLMLMAIEPSMDWKQIQAPISPKKETNELNEGVFKMKLYIEELRVNNASPSLSSSNELIDSLIRFLGLQASVDQIRKILEARAKHFDLFGKAVDLILDMIKQQKDDIYEALLIFNRIFRKSADEAGYLMVDYSGLAKTVVTARVGKLALLIGHVVDFVCKPGTAARDKEVLLAVESLKWMWRGKELECVTQIDIGRIWNSCSAQLGHNEAFRLSVIDLCFFLLRFCARKAKDLQQDDEGETLTLKKQTSVVDETSMADILNENFMFLIDIIAENTKTIQQTPAHLLLKEFEQVRSVRNPEDTEKNLIDLVVNTEVDNCPNTTRGEELPFIKKMHTIEKEIKKEEKKILEGQLDDEGKPIEDTIITTEKIEITEETPEYQAYQAIICKLKEQKSEKIKLERCVEEVSLILSVFYYYVYSAPDMATLFFDHEGNLLPVLNLAIGPYPSRLKVLACKVLEQLAPLVPASAFKDKEGFLKKILGNMVPFYENLFSDSKKVNTASNQLLNSYHSLLRTLLFTPFYRQTVTEVLIEAWPTSSSTGIFQLLDLLDLSSGDPSIVGSTVYDRFDPMKEQMLLLETSPMTFTKVYLRDILHYRFDLTSDKNVCDYRLDRKDNYRSRFPCLILRTKNFRYLLKEELSRFVPICHRTDVEDAFEKFALGKLAESLDASNSTNLLVLYKMAIICQYTQSSKLKPIVELILKKIGETENYHYSDSEISCAVLEKLQRISSTTGHKISQVVTSSPSHDSSLSKYQKMKERLYGKITSDSQNRPRVATKSYWETQFGSQALNDKRFNYNIANYKPHLDLSVKFDSPSADLHSRPGLSNMTTLLAQGIEQAALKLRYATRQPADLPSLAVKLSRAHQAFSHRHHNLAEAADFETMLEVVLAESSKPALLDLADHLFRTPTTDLGSTLSLLSRIEKRCRSAELAQQSLFFLLREIHRLTTAQPRDTETNNRLLVAYVSALETAANLAKSLPQGSLYLEGENLARFDDILGCLVLPEPGDTYSFKRSHKLEYIQNILLHFSRYFLMVSNFKACDLQKGSEKALAKLNETNRHIEWMSRYPNASKDSTSWQDLLIQGILFTQLTSEDSDLHKSHSINFSRHSTRYPLTSVPIAENVPYAYFSVYDPNRCDPRPVRFDLLAPTGNIQDQVSTGGEHPLDLNAVARGSLDSGLTRSHVISTDITATVFTEGFPSKFEQLIASRLQRGRQLGEPGPADWGYNYYSDSPNVAVLGGVAYWLDDYEDPDIYWLLDFGVTAAGGLSGSNDSVAYYKAGSKELVLVDASQRDRSLMLHAHASNRENGFYLMEVIDLARFPPDDASFSRGQELGRAR
jgi:hypothetical protein